MTDAEYRDRHRDQEWDDSTLKRCPTCGRTFNTADRVDVHHHDGDPSNGHPANRRKRCQRCHLKGEHDRDVEPSGPSRPRTSPGRPRTAPR